MVVRAKSRKRKLLGQRSWGVGNIKNKRGKGSRGGTGKGGKKARWTYVVVHERESMRTKGFSQWKKIKLDVVSISDIAKMAAVSGKKEIELKGCKVLGGGVLSVPVVVKADSFSKSAMDKISKSGGEARKL